MPPFVLSISLSCFVSSVVCCHILCLFLSDFICKTLLGFPHVLVYAKVEFRCGYPLASGFVLLILDSFRIIKGEVGNRRLSRPFSKTFMLIPIQYLNKQGSRNNGLLITAPYTKSLQVLITTPITIVFELQMLLLETGWFGLDIGKTVIMSVFCKQIRTQIKITRLYSNLL